MIENDVHAMFVMTIGMGVAAILMAWVIFVGGLERWCWWWWWLMGMMATCFGGRGVVNMGILRNHTSE